MRNFFFISSLLILACACNSTKSVIYLEDSQDEVLQSAPSLYEQKYTPDDQLAITVTAVNPLAVAVFNLPLASHPSMGEVEIYSGYQLQVYTVDTDGYINYPVLGKIKVAGLTRTELVNNLQQQIAKYADNPIVTIQQTNFKVTVLGEVAKPGPVKVTSDRITILDAVGAAGDLTIYGDRKRILLIRETNGVKETRTLDITSKQILSSPYYYLCQNDVIYVAPNKPRQANSLFSQMDQYNIQIISTIISALSVLTSLSIAIFMNK